MKIRTQLKAGLIAANHNETLSVRSALKAGRLGIIVNHNDGLHVRSSLAAGGVRRNCNETLKVRTTLKAGTCGESLNHNDNVRRKLARPAISMRRQVPTTGGQQERLDLLVVRAGLRAGGARGRETSART
jgi:hypothetical protein